MTPFGPVPLALVVVLAQAPAAPNRIVPEAARGGCLSTSEIRDAIQTKQSIPPSRAAAVALREGGDLMAIKLCRSADQSLYYDVAVLRRDGKLVHIYLDAGSGAQQPARR